MNRSSLWAAILLLWLWTANPVPAGPLSPPLSSLADLQSTVTQNGRLITSFRTEGLVCCVRPDRNWVVLADDSAAVLFELPELDPQVQPGERISIRGENSTLTRGEFGIQVNTAPVVEVDGLHPPTQCSGSTYLAAGRHPLRVEWFNGPMTCALELNYAGPGIARQRIPSSALWHRGAGTNEYLPGLAYASYLGNNWTVLPDFQKLTPTARGVTSNFDLQVRPRSEDVGLVFTGFLEVPAAGIYTFDDRSDDGSRVLIGSPATACTVTALGNAANAPVPRELVQVLAGNNNSAWSTAEGEVRFTSRVRDQVELELLVKGISLSVVAPHSGALSVSNLLHRRVRVTGVCQVMREANVESLARLIVPSGRQIEVLDSPPAEGGTNTLTSAGEIRALSRELARKSLPIKIRGVITMVNYWSLVLQDTSGGVFVQYAADTSANRPQPGELWEITGRTDPGDFSPIVLASHGECLGRAALPPPVVPTREQLMNSSVDADCVEIHGVLTDINASEMELLTAEGRVRILSKSSYPLPAIPPECDTNRLLTSVVRVRGVFAAKWDNATLRVEPGKCFIGDPMLSVDELAPRDPFQTPAKHAADLLLFTSHLDVLTRVKVAGQVLFARPHEYILRDGEVSLRVQTRDRLSLQAGDLAEAVGFPQLGGPSPVLLEATARKTGDAPLPVPEPVSAEALAGGHADATPVQVEARLLSDEIRRGERVLELRAGLNHFLARLKLSAYPSSTIRPGSLLRLTGIYFSLREDEAVNDLGAFELLLNQPSDIVVLEPGPWWTRRHTVAVIAVLSGGLFLALAWVTLLRRVVAQRTAELQKESEQRQISEQRRTMERERRRMAQDLHDELGAGLAEVCILSSLARNSAMENEKKNQSLERLAAVSRSLVTALDEIVWAINPRDDSTASVRGYLCDYAQEFLRLNSIGCRLDIARQQLAQTLSSQQRHQLFLAFKEALTNVVKHSGATEVWIRMREDQDGLSITVEDNGRGLPANGATKGDGLANMKERLANLGGFCECLSRPGNGCLIRFHLPSQTIRFPISSGGTDTEGYR